MKNKISLKIIISSLLICILMFLFETIAQPTYIIKSVAKIMLFGVCAFGMYFIIGFKNIKGQIYRSVKEMKISIYLCIACVLCIAIGGYLFSGFIDFEAMRISLANREKVTESNYLFVTVYIALVNSLLEEFFFRGYIFYELSNIGSKKLAYIYSSLLFSLYHISIINGWFNPVIFIMMIVGLFIVGIFFDWLTSRYSSFKASWVVHIVANVMINTIGYVYMF